MKSTENHPPQIVEVKRYSPWFTFGPHSHANIEINFVRQGYCFMRIDKDVIAYREGDIMVIFPDTPHYFYVEDRAATLVQLEFQTDRLPNLAEILAHNQSLSIFRTIRRRSRNHLKIVNQPTLTALLHTIVREHHQALPGSARLLELYYEQLLIMLSRHITSQQVSGEKPGKDLVQKALDILYNSLHEPPAVSLLASHCGVSGRYLQTLFRLHTGHSPSEIIAKARIDTACQLIAEGGQSFKHIAHATGFGYQSHFNKVFQKHTGMTPGHYQELLFRNV